MSHNNFSVIYFSIFTPDTFQEKVKNKFIINKAHNQQDNKQFNMKTSANDSKIHLRKKSLPNDKSFHCKTVSNSYNEYPSKNANILFRDSITSSVPQKDNRRKISKKKFNIIQGKLEPYKQYILEKREIEKIREKREIEKKYKMESIMQQENRLLNEMKSKYEGYDFSKNQSKTGFLEKIIESKNYSKEKLKDFSRPAVNYSKNKYDFVVMELFEDIKANRRKNIFEEDFDIKTSTKYNNFRSKAISFIKYLRHNPNYNYWIRK
jgi:hypothetical protein